MARLDNVRISGNSIVVSPDLTATKTARKNNGTITQVTQPDDSFDWRIEVKANNAEAVFPAASTWFLDNLPAGPTYGGSVAVTAANPASVPSSLNACAIAAGTITCTTGNGDAASRTLAAGQSLFVTISVDPAASGSLINPAGGGACKADNLALLPESNEGNNTCSNSVTVNPAAYNKTLCEAGNVHACIALLHPYNFAQLNPDNACGGIDANFVIDRSGSIDSAELVQLKGGIPSFATALSAGSVYSGTKFHTTASALTAGYVSATTFNSAVNGISSGTSTWTEGGIQVATTNTANATANPDMMFIVTDGGPNQVDNTGQTDLSSEMLWVNAANDAIDAANAARTAGFIVRAVCAGDPDSNMPWPNNADKIAFANAVLSGLGGGSFLSGSSGRCDDLLASAGCDPTVNKANGVPTQDAGNPGGIFEYVDWTITLTNSALTAKTTSRSSTRAPIACIPSLRLAQADRARPAQVQARGSARSPPRRTVQRAATLKVRTTLGGYNVCEGTSGSNTVTVEDGATGTSTASFTIPAQPDDPSCLGTIVVHKEEGGYLANAKLTLWNFALSGGTAKTDQVSRIPGRPLHGLAPGTSRRRNATAAPSQIVMAPASAPSTVDGSNPTATRARPRAAISVAAAQTVPRLLQEHRLRWNNCHQQVQLAPIRRSPPEATPRGLSTSRSAAIQPPPTTK